MKRYDTVYKFVSIANVLMHILLFASVVAAGFLPFSHDKSFYQSYSGAQPFLLLLLLLLAGVLAFFAVKRPMLSILSAVAVGGFFLLVAFPYVFEAFIYTLAKQEPPLLYGVGFDWMMRISRVFYWDVCFAAYAVVTVFMRWKNARKPNK